MRTNFIKTSVPGHLVLDLRMWHYQVAISDRITFNYHPVDHSYYKISFSTLNRCDTMSVKIIRMGEDFGARTSIAKHTTLRVSSIIQ